MSQPQSQLQAHHGHSHSQPSCQKEEEGKGVQRARRKKDRFWIIYIHHEQHCPSPSVGQCWPTQKKTAPKVLENDGSTFRTSMRPLLLSDGEGGAQGGVTSWLQAAGRQCLADTDWLEGCCRWSKAVGRADRHHKGYPSIPSSATLPSIPPLLCTNMCAFLVCVYSAPPPPSCAPIRGHPQQSLDAVLCACRQKAEKLISSGFSL